MLVAIALFSCSQAPSYRFLSVSYDATGDFTAQTIVQHDSSQTVKQVVNGWNPSLFPDGRLAYVASEHEENNQGNGDIWVLDLKSGKKTNLTNTHMVNEFNPTVSTDGKYIAYFTGANNGGLCIMNSDGSDNWCLDTMNWVYTINCSEYDLPPTGSCSDRLNIMSFVWSPVVKNGIYDIVFESNWEGEGNKLYHMVLDEGSLLYMNLIADKAVAQAISPGGTLIFASYLNDTIDQINFDGSGRKVLINQEARDIVWSQDGSRFAYTGYTPEGVGSVYMANSDGSDPKIVAEGSSPAWSLDGTFILFEKQFRTDAQIFGHTNLYKYDLSSGQETPVLENKDSFFNYDILFLN